MHFKRSFYGYHPGTVADELTARQAVYQRQEEEMAVAVKESLEEFRAREQQAKSMAEQLDNARGSRLRLNFLRSYLDHHLPETAQEQADQIIHNLVKTRVRLEDEAEQQLKLLNALADKIKREVRSTVKVTEDLLDLNVFWDTDGQDLARETDRFLAQAESEREPHGDGPDLAQKGLAQAALTLFEDMAAVLQHTEEEKMSSRFKMPALTDELKSTISSAFGGSPTVFLAENDEGALELLRKIMIQAGFQVKVAMDGYQAVKYVHAGSPPELVMINMLLPYIDGLQLIRQIRRKPAWNKVPIISFAPRLNEAEMSEILEAGADECLKTPFNPAELFMKVGRLGDARKAVN